MRIATMALAAAIAVAAPATAQAAVIFNVNGAFVGGGTLTGTFTTNDAITDLTAINLASSASGSFSAVNYSNLANVSVEALPDNFKITFGNGTNARLLQLSFNPALTSNGGAIGTGSLETQGTGGNARTRNVTGAVTVTSPVPEPATWAMMLVGFGAVGAATRYRRRSTKIAYA